MKSRTGNHTRAAIHLSFADKDDTQSVSRCAYYMHGLIKASFVLVDLPGVLLAGFALHLDRLQKLAVAPDFAFASQIAPQDYSGHIEIQPPSYASGGDFKYNLQELQTKQNDGTPLSIRPIRSDSRNEDLCMTLQALKTQTSLDEGQAVALYENLSRELGMTQGPPGMIGSGLLCPRAFECHIMLTIL